MNLHYKNEFEDFRNHYDFLNHGSFDSSRDAYHSSLSLPVILAAAGIGGSWNENPFISCVIAAALFCYLYRVLPYSKVWHRAMDAYIRSYPEKTIRMEIRPDGLMEHVEGIESFCPWHSIKGFYLFRDTLFIELTASLWALIPSRTLSADSPRLAEVITLLKSKGITEKIPPFQREHPAVK
jgi:hypothetical protein